MNALVSAAKPTFSKKYLKMTWMEFHKYRARKKNVKQ